MVERVLITPEAAQIVEKLRLAHGPLVFYQAAGCCEGFAPQCYPQAEYWRSARDLMIGTIAGCDYFMGETGFEVWQHSQMIVDVAPGVGNGFSLEATEGMSFVLRSRIFTDEECAELATAGAPPRAA